MLLTIPVRVLGSSLPFFGVLTVPVVLVIILTIGVVFVTAFSIAFVLVATLSMTIVLASFWQSSRNQQ